MCKRLRVKLPPHLTTFSLLLLDYNIKERMPHVYTEIFSNKVDNVAAKAGKHTINRSQKKKSPLCMCIEMVAHADIQVFNAQPQLYNNNSQRKYFFLI